NSTDATYFWYLPPTTRIVGGWPTIRPSKEVGPVPEVHLPHLDDQEEAGAGSAPDRNDAVPRARPNVTHRSKSLLKIGLEVLLITGIQPASFEGTAWDLALITQSLTFVDPSLAFALSRIYTTQQAYAELSRGILHAMYLLPPMSENPTPFFGALSVYYGDIVY